MCDVSVESEVEAAVAEARAAMGGLDGVFVNAGTDGEGLAATELDVGHFRRGTRRQRHRGVPGGPGGIAGSAPALGHRLQRLRQCPEAGAQLPRLQRQQGGGGEHGQVTGTGNERLGDFSDRPVPRVLPDAA